MPEIVVTSSRRDINNSKDASNSGGRQNSRDHSNSSGSRKAKAINNIGNRIAGSTAVAEATGTLRETTSKGTLAAAGIL
jgi:hypothetical protein